jgi:hypothetical protein
MSGELKPTSYADSNRQSIGRSPNVQRHFVETVRTMCLQYACALNNTHYRESNMLIRKVRGSKILIREVGGKMMDFTIYLIQHYFSAAPPLIPLCQRMLVLNRRTVETLAIEIRHCQQDLKR